MQATNKLNLLFDDTSFSFRSFVGLVTIVGLVVLWNAPAVHTAPGMYPQDAHINVKVLGVSNDDFDWFDTSGKPSPEKFMGFHGFGTQNAGYRHVHLRLLITGKPLCFTSTYRFIPTAGYRYEEVIGFSGGDQGQSFDVLVSVPDATKVLPPLKFQIQNGQGKLCDNFPIRGRNGQFDLPIKEIHDIGFGTQVVIKDYLEPDQLYSMDVMTTNGLMTHQTGGMDVTDGKDKQTFLQANVNKWDISRIYVYASPTKTFTFSNIVVPPLPPKSGSNTL